ncbi:histone acetyltransferase, MYST superfamily [Mycena floridula]|nr:histone acetyltransferase, MYST superfamily [Mycena floridula]
MSPATPVSDVPLPPPVKTPGGSYTLQTVSVGCKIYIQRPGSDGTTEERLAEILSIRDKPVNPYAQLLTNGAEPKPEDKWEFFVHWDSFNKRLDDWVPGSRLVLSRELEWPRPKVVAPKKGGPSQKAPGKAPRAHHLLKQATSNATFASSSAPPTPGHFSASYAPSPSPAPPRRGDEDEEEEPEDLDADADGDMDIDDSELQSFDITMAEPSGESQPSQPETFSKEQEIEKLRTSGSMTQSISEIARVKNLNRLQIGKHEVEAWYFSPYPKEYAHLPILYICEFCLSYFPSPMMISRHRKRCNMLHPPGNEIYRHDDISFYEIDGKHQLTWCRNLSLLSKCFLDHKTLYYDVTPFMYYVMVQRDSTGCHTIGYFSKEKESSENYNVACILTLPQHQRHGFGKVLIEFSYELSKKENKLGSPEKPLSDLGLLGYRSYWVETIADLLLNCPDNDLSIDEIAQRTSITHADVMNTCTTFQMFKQNKGQNFLVVTNAVKEKHAKAMSKRKRRIHPECLKWKPPVFTRDQLRFGW